jgi:predicted DsbA family dithiol-disulfide isomerase
MNAIVPFAVAPRRTLDIDLVGDFTCPWSWLGMLQVNRALGHLQGDVQPRLRWHPFRLQRRADTGEAATAPSFRDYLSGRLPHGVSPDDAEHSLTQAGRSLGIEFHFERLSSVPDTSEAHRLTLLAMREEKQAQVAAAIFRAYFVDGRDIGKREVLAAIAAETGLSDALIADFVGSRAGDDEVARQELRLQGFGVRAVPNLLFNGRVLVPGAVDVNTYVAALDQTLFPSDEESAPRRLH